MKLSVVIPAHNEAGNIRDCLHSLRTVLTEAKEIPSFEIIVVEDNSTDATGEILREEHEADARIRFVSRRPPGGFGRAVRSGLEAVTGDVVVVFMADLSDDPKNVVAYYRKILEGYDCVFGSRFIQGSRVTGYPRFKLFVNRVVNRLVQCLFWTRFNDLTNAFKAYRTDVIRVRAVSFQPLQPHFGDVAWGVVAALSHHANSYQLDGPHGGAYQSAVGRDGPPVFEHALESIFRADSDLRRLARRAFGDGHSKRHALRPGTSRQAVGAGHGKPADGAALKRHRIGRSLARSRPGENRRIFPA